MKYVISLLISMNVCANPIHLFYESEIQDALIFKNILIADYKIPEELITLKKTAMCEGAKREGRLDLCLKNNGDLFVVSVDREFINESLKVFQAP